MHLAHKEHQFELLSAMAISERWSMSSALNAKNEPAAAADSLQSIVQMSKLKSPKVRLPDSNDEGRAVPASKPTKQVVYVRLRRNERANQVVLSSAEKYSYAKAMLEPLLEYLSNLSSADFCQCSGAAVALASEEDVRLHESLLLSSLIRSLNMVR
ncbi:hypothetical protein JG687_00016182 [Phytophthora cactorum]|uniref:Uncharacterized protein n=1 Tax=Phytophthora cactorum TaxID=29920 RepID=A0A8T1TWP0_9STRA|nr:hypothetical protein JG687_00016182 [Phytophthora cactorum]